MKCLETRKRDGMKWRRYRLPDGRTYTTYELPENVLRHLTMSRVKCLLEGFERQEAKRARTAGIKALIARKIKPLAIADQFNVTPAYVQRVARNMKAKPKGDRNDGTHRKGMAPPNRQ